MKQKFYYFFFVVSGLGLKYIFSQPIPKIKQQLFKSYVAPKVKKKKNFYRKLVNYINGGITMSAVTVAVVVAHKKYRESQDSTTQVEGLLQQNSTLQQEQNRLQGDNERLDTAISSLEEQNSNLQAAQSSLQNQNQNLTEQNQNLTQENQTLREARSRVVTRVVTDLGELYGEKDEDLHHISNIHDEHAATGCEHRTFERWLHPDEKANKNSINGERYDKPYTPYGSFSNRGYVCDVCEQRIFICYYADGVALWHCKNFDHHADDGGFHVCRACVTGKSREPCSQCRTGHVQVFPSEPQGLCLACVGYNRLIKSYEKIIEMTGLPQHFYPAIDDQYNSVNEWAAKSKKFEDIYVIEDIEGKMEAFQKRYVHWKDGEKWPLSQVKNTIDSLAFDHKESIISLLGNQENKIIICPFYRYSWRSHQWYPGGPPQISQDQLFCFVKPSSGGENRATEAYILILGSTPRAMGS